jgi:branched-subunit amino acid aminotransferase/4-amino-4-deoxychorismate lyase
MQLRRKAIVHGADEAVLVTADGFISEGALSALVWWQGDVLCAPDQEIPWIDSVTRREVFDIAKALGLEARLVKARPADLAGLEVWGLSSLQGIRPVADWVNLGAPIANPSANPSATSSASNSHLETFKRRLKMLAGPMTTQPAPVAPTLPVWNN